MKTPNILYLLSISFYCALQNIHCHNITTTAKKRKSPTGYSDDDSDEDAPDTPTTSALMNRIRVVKYGKKIRRTSATVIKDALRVGETYDIVDIEAANTRHGPTQVWSLKGTEDDDSIKKIFSCADLHQFTTGADGKLDLEARSEMIDRVRVVYNGLQGPEGDEPSKYDFDFLLEKSPH